MWRALITIVLVDTLAAAVVHLRLQGAISLQADADDYEARRPTIDRPLGVDEHAKLRAAREHIPHTDMSRDIVEPCDLPCREDEKCFLFDYGGYLVCQKPCASNLDCSIDELCHCIGPNCNLGAHHCAMGHCMPNPF